MRAPTPVRRHTPPAPPAPRRPVPVKAPPVPLPPPPVVDLARIEPRPTIGIIASGPSACLEDVEKLQSLCDAVIAVNDNWRFLRASSVANPPPSLVYACDYRWWMFYCHDLADFDGERWTQDQCWGTEQKPIDPAQWGIRQLRSYDKPGLCREAGAIFTGGNSGYQAINLAWHLLNERYSLPGRILLLGFDMCEWGGRSHWFGDHPGTLQSSSKDKYRKLIERFGTIRPESYQLEIWNCTRRTALHCFTELDLDAVCAAFTDRTICPIIDPEAQASAQAYAGSR